MGIKIVIKSIMLKDDGKGSCIMDIEVRDDICTARVIITKTDRTDAYDMETALGVTTISVNGNSPGFNR